MNRRAFLALLGAGAAGTAVARSGLRPVRQLTAAVEYVAQTDDLTPIFRSYSLSWWEKIASWIRVQKVPAAYRPYTAGG